ncbi:MAG: hypothetical protein HZB17_08495 [Chloroflexi bacterium]|nr:hypothetical protein [Chloroflexota bacterium]
MKIKLFLALSLITLAACVNNPTPANNLPTDFSNGVWRGITIGKSNEQDVLKILGTPNEKIAQSGTTIYRRDGRQIILQFADGVVDQVTINFEEVRAASGAQIMLDLVKALGRPEWVTWSPLEESRTLIWANKGVAATDLVNRLNVDAPQNLIRGMDLFPKLELGAYKQSKYYLARVPPTNPNLASDGSLGKIEDPFKWELFLTVTATP